MSKDNLLICGAAFLRALGVGLVGVLFSLYLATGGLDAARIGILIALGIAGNACGTFFVSFFADQLGRRKTLILLSGLTALGGFGVSLFPRFLGMMLAVFFGMVNAMGRERGPMFTLEQAILPQTAQANQRTQVLAWYNVLLDVGQAVGSLLGGLPFLLRQRIGIAELASYQWAFSLYAGLGTLSFLLYMGLSPRVEIHGPTPWHKVSPQSRRILTRLCLLFGFDSLAGGFLPATLIAYWFFKRFGVGEQLLAPLFFAAHLANALSYLGAAWISRRVGLVNTMVFAHLCANLSLIAIPFSPTLKFAILLYLIRESLVEMDVPTRQSYVLAVVGEGERTIAAGVTNLTRLTAWIFGPGLAGLAMKGLSLSFPLFFGGGLKILYDLSLYASFRNLKPPEER